MISIVISIVIYIQLFQNNVIYYKLILQWGWNTYFKNVFALFNCHSISTDR